MYEYLLKNNLLYSSIIVIKIKQGPIQSQQICNTKYLFRLFWYEYFLSIRNKYPKSFASELENFSKNLIRLHKNLLYLY